MIYGFIRLKKKYVLKKIKMKKKLTFLCFFVTFFHFCLYLCLISNRFMVFSVAGPSVQVNMAQWAACCCFTGPSTRHLEILKIWSKTLFTFRLHVIVVITKVAYSGFLHKNTGLLSQTSESAEVSWAVRLRCYERLESESTLGCVLMSHCVASGRRGVCRIRSQREGMS